MPAADRPTESPPDRDPAATTALCSDRAATTPQPASCRYVPGDEIARGGTGIDYQIAKTAVGREVALKVLQDQFGPGSSAARPFADEARITGRLQPLASRPSTTWAPCPTAGRSWP